jgi:hypothetical protein
MNAFSSSVPAPFTAPILKANWNAMPSVHVLPHPVNAYSKQAGSPKASENIRRPPLSEVLNRKVGVFTCEGREATAEL